LGMFGAAVKKFGSVKGAGGRIVPPPPQAK